MRMIEETLVIFGTCRTFGVGVRSARCPQSQCRASSQSPGRDLQSGYAPPSLVHPDILIYRPFCVPSVRPWGCLSCPGFRVLSLAQYSMAGIRL